MDEIRRIINDPARFFSKISLGGFKISGNLLQELNSYFRTLYPANQAFIGFAI
jgi:hypothetical protein